MFRHPMPDERDDEYAEIHEEAKKPLYIRFGLFIAMIAMTGLTVAANISLNDNGPAEFGQGIYQIKSCDQFVAIRMNPTDTYGDGFSRVRSIEIRGLDVARCANTSVRIKLFDSVNTAALDLFTNPQYTKSGVTYPCCTETGTAVTLIIGANAQQTTALQNTTLLSPSGKNIAQGDRSQSLTYDATTGVFAIAFAVPLAVMPNVARTTLESAPNV
jgi:hypothetical protein